MFKKLLVSAVLLLTLGLVSPVVAVDDFEMSEGLKDIVINVVICESGGNHEGVWGDTNYRYPAYGIAQFQRRTFYEMADKMNWMDADWFKKEDQLIILAWAIQNGYGYKWTCFNKLYKGT